MLERQFMYTASVKTPQIHHRRPHKTPLYPFSFLLRSPKSPYATTRDLLAPLPLFSLFLFLLQSTNINCPCTVDKKRLETHYISLGQE